MYLEKHAFVKGFFQSFISKPKLGGCSNVLGCIAVHSEVFLGYMATMLGSRIGFGGILLTQPGWLNGLNFLGLHV